MDTPISITITSSGRNTIPSFKPDGIIQIHGRNGVGKSMAATMLEIASGNYVFSGENQFNKLKNVIESCNISIQARGGQERLEVKLTPATWIYNQNLNSVHTRSIGDYRYNDKDITFEDFKKKMNIRVIHDNESLIHQVYFFKDIFTAKFNQRIDMLENSLQLMEGYKERLFQNVSEEELKDYEQKNEKYAGILNKIGNLDTSITSREETLKAQRKQIPILEKLLLVLEYRGQDLVSAQRESQEQLIGLKGQVEAKIKEKLGLEAKFKELNDKADKELQDWIAKKENLEKKILKIKESLSGLFDADAVEKLIKVENQEANIKGVQGQIETLENSLNRVKKEFDNLNVKSSRVLGINGFLARVEEYCNQVQNEPYAKDTFIQLSGPGGGIKISPYDLLEFIKKSKQEFSENQQLKEYEKKVTQINEQVLNLKRKKEVLGELERTKKNILSLSQMITSKGTNIPDLLDKSNLVAIPERIKVVKAAIDDLNASVAIYQVKLDDLSKKATELSGLPSENALALDLKNLGCSIKELNLSACKSQLALVKKEVSKNENMLEDHKNTRSDLDPKLTDSKRQVEQYTERFRTVAKKFGFSQYGEFLEYFRAHASRIHKFCALLKNLSSKLQSLLKDLDAVVSGKSPRNSKNEELIVGEFDRIFKEMYGHPEFFKYVFKDYAGIKRFDIKARTIVFETRTGMEEKRDLNEFSSGEKTYAYCRAIISMLAHSAEYSVIILDESYALLDHEHSEDLYQFQKLQIREGGIAKFINILPLKEDLDAVVMKMRADVEKDIKLGNTADQALLEKQLREYEAYLQEVKQGGYYQRVIPLD